MGLAVAGLVDIFVGAVTNSVIGNVEGKKSARWAAKAGGFLTGLYIADKVSDHVCGMIDDGAEKYEELMSKMSEDEE